MLSIKHFVSKIKGYFPESQSRELLTALIIVLVASASFGLGRLSVAEGEHEPVRIEYAQEQAGTVINATKAASDQKGNTAIVETQSGAVVASKNSDKYHYPWCAGAAKISEANKIFFNSKEEAEAAGYKPASNCPGL
jgi:hypothetical protein